ncbi:MAG: hypothetical protein K0R52_1191 [Alphaproteobacteria bacterium]|jgi:hypothetical protein|nr:hypothetical protein [Alphaproteobacteria bacterium]
MTYIKSIQKVEYLVKKIFETLDQETNRQGVTIEEYFDIIGRFLAHACKNEAQSSNSFETLEGKERKVIAFLRKVIDPLFEERRKQLQQQLPAQVIKPRTERLYDQIGDILTQQEITPAEGLFVVGELLSLVTLLHAPNVKAQSQLKEIEKNTLVYMTGKLELALDMIRIQQGFVRKH